MAALDQTFANAVLAASLRGVTLPATTTPIMVRLTTTLPTGTSAGSYVSGGSYAHQSVTFATESGGSIASNVAVNFTGMPATTVVGIELWESSGTPRRIWYGGLTGGGKTTNSGDTFQIASGSLTAALA